MRKSALEEGERWLSQAAEDLKWAKHLAEQGGWHIACFLSQQVTEKALKAFIYAQGEEIVLGHSVARLCAEAAGYQAEFSNKANRWSVLDGYYIPTRYPNSSSFTILLENALDTSKPLSFHHRIGIPLVFVSTASRCTSPCHQEYIMMKGRILVIPVGGYICKEILTYSC
jgi:HEPN domain-containing protein